MLELFLAFCDKEAFTTSTNNDFTFGVFFIVIQTNNILFTYANLFSDWLCEWTIYFVIDKNNSPAYANFSSMISWMSSSKVMRVVVSFLPMGIRGS